MALTEFVEGVLNRFYKEEAVCAVLHDLSKVFDSRDRRILLNKLMQFLIKSYFTEREQYVNFCGYEQHVIYLT